MIIIPTIQLIIILIINTIHITRSAGKSAYQGKPQIGSRETSDAGCGFAVPKAPDGGCFSRPANSCISLYRGFPENLITQAVIPVSVRKTILRRRGPLEFPRGRSLWVSPDPALSGTPRSDLWPRRPQCLSPRGPYRGPCVA